jgi:hypothetical protein
MEPAPSPKPCQKPKILAAHRCIFSVNALGCAKAQWERGGAESQPQRQELVRAFREFALLRLVSDTTALLNGASVKRRSSIINGG